MTDLEQLFGANYYLFIKFFVTLGYSVKDFFYICTYKS